MKVPKSSLVLVLSVVIVAGPGVAFADGDDQLRSAGDEERFRVIERFPDDETDEPTVELPEFDDGPFSQVVDRVERDQWQAAADQLGADELAEPVERDPEKRFLAGYVALETGDADGALEMFDGLGERLAPLESYVAYYEAKAALEADDPHRATVSAARVSDDSRLHPDALGVLARALLEAGESEDRRRAVEVLEVLVDEYDDEAGTAEHLWLLAETLEELERPERAAEAYLRLRNEHPLSDRADEARSRLEEMADDLDDQMAGRVDEDSIDRTMRKYRQLHGLHRSERVIDELGEELDEFSRKGTSDYCEALYMVADSHTKLRRHGDAVGWYDRVLEECADVEDYEVRALYRTARSRWNAGNYQGALDHWERIWEEYPDHSFADDAKHFTARILRSMDEHDRAVEYLHRQVERYPDGDMAGDGHWLIVRHHFERDDYREAVDYVEGLDDTGEDDLYTRGRLAYFRGRALERLGEHSEAEEAFSEVVAEHPKSYYALLAFNRLARLEGENPDSICEAVAELCDEHLGGEGTTERVEIPRELSSADGFQRGSLLLGLGLNEQARAEFDRLRRNHSGDDETLWALADLLDDAGAHPISHQVARRHIHGWMDQYPDASTRSYWEIGYPTPFDQKVGEYAQRREGIDAPKVHAVMREESGFSPRIESWANAVGLLQLLEDTGRRMANRVGLESYSVADLRKPETNIRLGTAYMEHLGERLEPHPVLIVAGYNAGSGNVAGWLEEFGDLDVDLFVEDIPFNQTRDYTKRVLQSWWIYTYLHGEERVPWLEFDLR